MNETETLTEDVLYLHNQIDEECGRKLTAIAGQLVPQGLWTQWQVDHKDKISISTIRRYRKENEDEYCQY